MKNLKKVIIGIVAKHKKEDVIRTESLIRDEIKQAIFDNGGIAVGILSPNEEILYSGDNWNCLENKIRKEEIKAQLNICDGIILQGGTTNEVYENWIAHYCYQNDIPVLGICAGQNCLVRGLGGTTFKIPNPEKHMKMTQKYVHTVKIEKGSNIYAILKRKEIMVNSRHKRTIDACPNLEKVGFCDDGYADVVVAKGKKFYIGVRFHPESLYKEDEIMNQIFKSFIERCSSYEN